MTVSVHTGLTESGKSWNVLHRVLPLWEKKVVYDIACCFTGDIVLVDPNDKKLTEIFMKYARISNYTIVIRPSRTTNEEILFNKVVQLACALGRVIGTKDPAKRVQFVCDESDFICSPNYQSRDLKHVVNKGRHDNVDSHFICRNPMRLHTDIRANCSKIVTFALKNAQKIDFFREMFGDDNVKLISNLPKYHRMEANEKGEVSIYDENNRIVGGIQSNSRKIKPENGGILK